MSAIKLNFWLMPNADFDTQHIIEKEISCFAKKHPQIEVVPRIIPWGRAWARLMEVFKHQAESVPPDVIQVGSTWVSTLGYLGVLRDMRGYFDESCSGDIIRPLREGMMYAADKRLIALPWLADIRLLFYRTDLLRRCGFSAEDLSTLQGFERVCAGLDRHCRTRAGMDAFRLSGQREVILIHDLAPWIWAMGGNFLSPDFKTPVFNSPAARKGMQWFFDLLWRLYGARGKHKRYAMTPGGSFFSGGYAMEIIGRSPLYTATQMRHSQYAPEVLRNYALAPLPSGPQGTAAPFIGGSGLAIPAWSRYPEAAAEWIRFLISSESQLRHSSRIGVYPSRRSVLEQYLSKDQWAAAAVFQSLQQGRGLPASPLLGTLEQIVNNLGETIWQAIISGRYTSTLLRQQIRKAEQEAVEIFSVYG